MTVTHHPSPELLAGFAAGTLDAGEHLAIAVHASGCSTCRRLVRAVEGIGGSTLEAIEPVPMKAGAFESVMAKLDRSPSHSRASADSLADEELPKVLQHYRIGRRRWVAPGVSMRPIELPGPSSSRAFLLRSDPGTHMLEHTHTGVELTCVLHGSFSHEGGRFGPGDFDFGDDALDHQPTVGEGEPCLCLVAMTGDLRINGFFGRLIGPFVRL
jgi:putative transcriptional regulator